MDQQLGEEIYRVRSRTKELLSLWSMGPVQWHMIVFYFTNLEALKPNLSVFMEA